MKSWAVTCGGELCFVPFLNGRNKEILGSSRTPGCSDVHISIVVRRDSSPSWDTMHITVLSLVRWWWELSGLSSTLLKCNKLQSKMSPCFNSCTLRVPLNVDRHTEKSMFSSYSDCIKNTDMRSWGKAHSQSLLSVPYKLKRGSGLNWNEEK